ncbi:MAG: fructose-bisphosphatase class II, partial [Proteobacteria bacterium]|nr:fructose-bisphosphatase class II [Pseudomonadota bacterium]
DERGRATKAGIEDLERKYELSDLAHGDVLFAATGVTDGSMLEGVRPVRGGVTTETMVMRAKTGTVRWIKARHDAVRALKGTIKQLVLS